MQVSRQTNALVCVSVCVCDSDTGTFQSTTAAFDCLLLSNFEQIFAFHT